VRDWRRSHGAACGLEFATARDPNRPHRSGDFAGPPPARPPRSFTAGVRYLEEAIKGADLQEYHVLVRALHERVRMLENAPHSRASRVPRAQLPLIDVAYLDIGLKIYDWLADRTHLPAISSLEEPEAHAG